MSASAIQRITIPVSDQAAAKQFYTEVLGFELVSDQPAPMGPNARWIEVRAGKTGPTVVLANWFPVAPGSVQGLMLESSDLERDCDVLRSQGRAVRGPNATPWGRQANVTDPDGNGLVLVESRPA